TCPGGERRARRYLIDPHRPLRAPVARAAPSRSRRLSRRGRGLPALVPRALDRHARHRHAQRREPLPYPRLGNALHVVALVAMGLWLIDNANLEELAVACAERRRWEFLLNHCAPAAPARHRLPGEPDRGVLRVHARPTTNREGHPLAMRASGHALSRS